MSNLNPVVKLKGTFNDFLVSHVPQRSKREVLESARRHLVELGLPANVLEVYPHQLSGGMRQRVVIALASFLAPRAVITDEPVTALDVVVQRGVLQLLKEVQERQQNALVIVTHDMGVLANIADRVGIMYAGKIIEEAPVDGHLRAAAASLHAVPDPLAAAVRRQAAAGERAGRAAVAGGPAGGLRVSPALQVCPADLPGAGAGEPAGGGPAPGRMLAGAGGLT